MEPITILFAPVVAFIASAIYTMVVKRLELPFQELLRIGSRPVVALFGFELVSLCLLGAAGSDKVFGYSFRVVCGVVFFLGPPAAANLIALREDGPPWYVVAALCAVLAFGLLMLLLYMGDAVGPAALDDSTWEPLNPATRP